METERTVLDLIGFLGCNAIGWLFTILGFTRNGNPEGTLVVKIIGIVVLLFSLFYFYNITRRVMHLEEIIKKLQTK